MIRKHIGNLFFLFLLPVFFVVHGFYENYEFIDLDDIVPLILIYWLLIVIAWAIIFLFSKSSLRAALITFVIFLMFFFFGWVQDLLKLNYATRAAARYSVLLPAWIISSIILIIYITRTEYRMRRMAFFLNILLAIYIAIDISSIVSIPPAKSNNTQHVENVSGSNVSHTLSRPNIYLLIFDEYAASLSLQERFGFRNDLDSVLKSRRFSIQSLSRSNYYSTPLSVASILDMSYLQGINDGHFVSAEDYNAAAKIIANADVFSFLNKRGYDLVNYSVFDIKGNPSGIDQSFIPIRAKLISDRVLTVRIVKDLGWRIYKLFPSIDRWKFKAYIHSNQACYEKVIKIASEEKFKPAFIYAHLFIPHAPYFFDRDGNRKKDKLVFEEMHLSSPKPYLEYVKYANSRIINMVDAIQKNDSSSVIVIMGDHGYRKHEPPGTVPPYFFRNFNAVYIPGASYSCLYDSITGVNQFRMILNEVFNQKIPKLEDRIIYHRDRQ